MRLWVARSGIDLCPVFSDEKPTTLFKQPVELYRECRQPCAEGPDEEVLALYFETVFGPLNRAAHYRQNYLLSLGL